MLEGWLKDRKWLVNEKMSIADVLFLAWYEEAFMVDIDIERVFPRVHNWLERMKTMLEIVAGSVGREMIAPAKLWQRETEKL